MKNSSKPKVAGWLALGAIALGILLTTIGLWILSWHPHTQPASAAAGEPTTTHIAAVLPTSTRQPATPTPQPATPTPLPPTATAVPTQTPEPPTPSPTASEPLELAIVHSNDTWGYTQPCG